MGLDMYLTKKTYVGNKFRKDRPSTLIKITVPQDQTGANFRIKPDSIKDERVSEIIEEIGYWRKANHIHNWFVVNCQEGEDDCREAYVDREDLESLLETCEKVLKASKLVDGKVVNGKEFIRGELVNNIEDGKVIEDSTVAQELLPTQSGFFFGSEGYDEWYIKDIEETVKIIEDALADPDAHSFYYQSSW